jgi:glucose-6-phosphate 1-dehydrogenase
MLNILPTQFIILGGGGDLSQKKLLPALFDLYVRNKLPRIFHIIGLARSSRNNDEYRELVKKSIDKNCSSLKYTQKDVDDFCSKISYTSGSFDSTKTYIDLNELINKFDTLSKTKSNKLFYLAVPPKYYGQIFNDLKESGVAKETRETWTHILVEKPFGHNLITAQILDSQLASLFKEKQIFRIDHYLAKEAVQNILSFRFANTLFKASWNKDSIESVTVTMTETIDVGNRADFYEGVGALRDVGQNHLLQLIALIAMREPEEFTANSIRNARSKVLQSLKPINKDDIEKIALRAQYEDYKINEKISDDSKTETYFELKAELTLKEWEGVPFYIRAGKALDKDTVSVKIKFKETTSLFNTNSEHITGNEIKLTISPKQAFDIVLNAKSPGLGFQLEPRKLSFTCATGDLSIKNSYEKVLYDSIVGDQTLFTKTEEVIAAWRFITPILETWDKLPLYSYQRGSCGPEQSIIPK